MQLWIDVFVFSKIPISVDRRHNALANMRKINVMIATVLSDLPESVTDQILLSGIARNAQAIKGNTIAGACRARHSVLHY